MAQTQPANTAGRGAPPVGTVVNGYRYDGGNHRDRSTWTQVERVDVSSEYGPGAYRFPNGTLIRVGPKGGVEQIDPVGADGEGAPTDLKEFQINAAARATLMDQGQTDYVAAVRDGYDPGSWWNSAARGVEAIPLVGIAASNLMRSPEADRGRAAELQFVDGALRTTSGANAPEPEQVRANRAYFPTYGESGDVLENKERLRDRFRSTSVRAAGPAYIAPEPDPDVGPIGENGLPTYPGIADRVEGIVEIPLPAGGYGPADAGPGPGPVGGPINPDAPRPGDVRVTAQPLAPTDTPNSLSAQGYVYDAGTDTWRRNRTEQAPSATSRGWTPESAVAQRRAMNPILRGADAFVRGAADTISLETADELAGGADALIGQGVGDDFSTRWANNNRVQRAVDAADGEDMLWARRAGNVVGAALPGVRLAQSALNGGRVLNGLRLAAGGAAGGAVSGLGSGEGSVLTRAPAALLGAGIGAVAAPVAGALGSGAVSLLQGGARFLGRQAGRVGEAVGVPGAAALTERATPSVLESAVNRFGQRQRPNASALTARADELEAMGIAPTFADLTDDAGRGILRANATRQTPARQAAREFADQRAEGLQDRVSTQARRTISDDPRSPDEIRAEISTRRAQEGDRAFGAVRGEMLTPEPQIVEALRSPAGRAAVEDAAVRASNRGDVETANQLRQLGTDALDNPNGVQITVGMADRIARTLNGLGEARRGTAVAPGDNDAAASFFSLAEALRGTARRQVPGYDDALKAYGDDSRLIQAATLGERFMTMEADEFAAAVARLSPDERQIARAAARRAVERQAGTQGRAPGTAQALAGGREQGMRSAALLDDPAPMQAAMRAERDGLMAARGVSPAQGSPTSQNLQDALQGAGDVAGAAREVATGNLPGLVGRFGRRFISRGFSDQEAEALVMASIDPARTREIIDLLVSRGVKPREARNTVRAIQRSAVQGSASSAASPQ